MNKTLLQMVIFLSLCGCRDTAKSEKSIIQDCCNEINLTLVFSDSGIESDNTHIFELKGNRLTFYKAVYSGLEHSDTLRLRPYKGTIISMSNIDSIEMDSINKLYCKGIKYKGDLESVKDNTFVYLYKDNKLDSYGAYAFYDLFPIEFKYIITTVLNNANIENIHASLSKNNSLNDSLPLYRKIYEELKTTYYEDVADIDLTLYEIVDDNTSNTNDYYVELKYDSAYFSKGNLQKSKYGTFYYCDTTISKKIPQYLKKRIVLLQKHLLNISSQKHSINLEGNRFQIYVEDKWIGDINRDSLTREIEEIQSILQIINNSSDIKNKL